MFLIVCGVIFVLGVGLKMSGWGIDTAQKLSDADREWDRSGIYRNHDFPPTCSFLHKDE